MKKDSVWQVLFHFGTSTGPIKIFSQWNDGQYKKLPWHKFAKKKTFSKTFRIMLILELQCLIDDFVYFLEL